MKIFKTVIIAVVAFVFGISTLPLIAAQPIGNFAYILSGYSGFSTPGNVAPFYQVGGTGAGTTAHCVMGAVQFTNSSSETVTISSANFSGGATYAVFASNSPDREVFIPNNQTASNFDLATLDNVAKTALIPWVACGT